ncbi:MAG: 2-oxo acid dehydrogenase subunit E2 [Deltaproteobacteria bacterium]|nr:2-oxo acid dehydrogenase subunit E2 [Deltaproteobacteria bacterium]
MPNVELWPPKPLPAFRRIAIGTWRTAYDPSVYGSVTLRMEPALAYMERIRAETGKRVTVTHFVAKAAALALSKVPEANAILRMNRVYERKRISIFLQVAMTDPETGKPDLSGVTIEDVDKLSIVDLVGATEKRVTEVRARKDPALEKTRQGFRFVPSFLLNALVNGLAFLLYTLNLDLSGLGLPKDGFGSLMVTNIGSLGLESAYVPLVPFSRVPILLAVGQVQEDAVIENGAVVAGKVLRLHATFDHRFIDGAHAAAMVKALKEAFADPAGAFA